MHLYLEFQLSTKGVGIGRESRLRSLIKLRRKLRGRLYKLWCRRRQLIIPAKGLVELAGIEPAASSLRILKPERDGETPNKPD